LRIHSPTALCAVIAFTAHVAPAIAARPFVVDDARVTDPGACQVETWLKRNPGSHEVWALPACNVAGVEFTAGGGVQSTNASGQSDQRDYQFQGKTLFRPLTTNDWGWGLAVGVVRHADIALRENLLANRYFYIPVSKSFADDRFVLLTNLGVVDNRDEKRRGVLWGAGGEYYLTQRTVLLGEVYGATGFDRFSQVGVRYWIVPDHVQVDTTYGFQWNGDHRTEWFTVGFRIISGKLF
jgi:hypothetical protein